MDIKTFSVSWTWLLLTVVATLTLLLTSSCTDAAYLNSYIHDYQPLHFDAAHVRLKHSRVRRQVDDVLRWNFKAYGRTFKLQLQRDKSVFSSDHILDFGDVEYPLDTSFFYTGSLSDVPNSRAHMSIHDGHISGQVFVPGDTTYFIEPAAHFTGLQNTTDFHTIIYPESRMDLDPFRHKRKGAGTCGGELHANLLKKFRPVGENIEERSEKAVPYLKYSAELNSSPKKSHHHRRKRAAGDLNRVPGKTCNMHLRADNLLYVHYRDNKYGGNAEQAKDAILSLFASHITVLTQIFEATTFDNPSRGISFNGINFVLQRTTIMENCNGVDDNYCRNTLDVTNYLHLTSEENHDNFCLVHTFTYRDFVGGTLGLAWVADSQSANSGFCGKNGRVSTDAGVEELSLNTGIVSFINYNEEVASKVSQITFAHEVGHNYGSQHDESAECAPYGTSQADASEGNYIMYAKATSGNLPNNKKFSSCSRSAIADVLNSVGEVRSNCFTESDQAFCGNKIVEEGEECDCGYFDECEDNCCNGRQETSDDCKRKASADCSPSEGSCCTDSCNFQTTSVRCAPSTSCTGESYCNGSSAVCPAPPQQGIETFCNDYQAVCDSGECTGSVCLNIGWQECFKTEEDGASEEELCYVSCRENANSECISSKDSTKVAQNTAFKNLLDTIQSNSSSVTDGGVQRPPGSPCNDYKGYCDVFSKCRSIDSEGPFKQLTDLIFNPVTFSNIRDWIKDHWWAVLLMCVGVIVFMGVFVKIFGYNTPSENPKRKRQNRQAPAARAGRAQPQGNKRRMDKRAAPYTTDTPMQQMPPRGGPGHMGGPPQGGAGPYFDNYAYDGREYYQPPPEYTANAPPPRSGHHQYDRIQGQRY